MTTITPTIRFAAHALRSRLSSGHARYVSRRPFFVEGFPHSYPAPMVERAQALLIRMADVEQAGGNADVTDPTLWADLVAFHEDLETSR